MECAFREAGKNDSLARGSVREFSETMFASQKEGFTPDLEYENSPGISDALSAVRSGAPVVFISGRAGSGKSRLIDYLKSMPGGRSQVVVAPTGIAAMNLNAVTIHSAFRLPLGVIDRDRLDPEDRISRIFKRMNRLIIDEISMVRADTLDAIDRRLRDIRGDDRPFGGAQVVLVGDFLQLPPVVTDDDRELLARMGYDTPFAFSARVLQGLRLRVATLTKVWRQSNPEMIQVLGEIREGRNTAHAVDWLNMHCARDHRAGVIPLMLTTTRAAADEYNDDGYHSLVQDTGERVCEGSFWAERFGAFRNERAILPAPDELKVVPGLRVMSVRNDSQGRYVNGSLGTVLSFDVGDGELGDAAVRVLFDGQEEPVSVPPARWTKTRQIWSEAEDAIMEEEVGAFEQIPLVHGYAITIHKSQGLSLDDVRVDLGRGAFAPGQLYVALSRARSPEGLSLARPISHRDVQVDELLVEFLRWARGSSRLEFQAKIG